MKNKVTKSSMHFNAQKLNSPFYSLQRHRFKKVNNVSVEKCQIKKIFKKSDLLTTFTIRNETR